MTREDLLNALDQPNTSFLLVDKDSTGRVVGYFLSYDIDFFLSAHPGWEKETGVDVRSLGDVKIVYGKHLASDGSVPSVGIKLNEFLFKNSKQKGYGLYIGEICEAPIENKKSKLVHTHLFSMKKIGEYTDRNAYKWGIYLKKL